MIVHYHCRPVLQTFNDLSATVLQGSVATRVNDSRIFNEFFTANLLLSVTVKNFEDPLGFGKK